MLSMCVYALNLSSVIRSHGKTVNAICVCVHLSVSRQINGYQKLFGTDKVLGAQNTRDARRAKKANKGKRDAGVGV